MRRATQYAAQELQFDVGRPCFASQYAEAEEGFLRKWDCGEIGKSEDFPPWHPSPALEEEVNSGFEQGAGNKAT